MHKAMMHAWVRNVNTGRSGQVRRVYKDSKGRQAGVYVRVQGEKTLSFWPTEFVRQISSKTRAKGGRTWTSTKS
jgi:hypothetical protein